MTKTMTPSTRPSSLIGTKIRKTFGDLGEFNGIVTKTTRVNSRTYYRVKYEDNDEEDITEHEVHQWMMVADKQTSTPQTNFNNREAENEYMERVQEKRQRNQAMLEKLGLLESPLKMKQSKRVSPPKKKKQTVKAQPQRLSQRVRKKPALYAEGLPDDWVEERNARKQFKRASTPSPQKTRKHWKSPLSSEQQQYASTFSRKYQKSEDEPPAVTLPSAGGPPCDEEYLQQLEHFLKTYHPVSPDNMRNVLKQAGRLCSGEGITYHHWPSHVVFGKGLQLTLLSNLETLYEQACDYEDFYGRDLGNGWLLRHPLKKMIYYQHYWKEQEQKKTQK